jgi:hypothetical protein
MHNAPLIISILLTLFTLGCRTYQPAPQANRPGSEGAVRADTRGFPNLNSTEFFISSLPAGLGCYIVPKGRCEIAPFTGVSNECFKEEFFKGKTPLKLTIEPGAYYVVFSVDKETMPAEWFLGRDAAWGNKETQHGSHFVMFEVSKGETSDAFICLCFDVSLSPEQVDALYPEGNNFPIADEAELRKQLKARGSSSTEIETAIRRAVRGGKAGLPIEPGKAAKLVVQLKPGGTWEILSRNR